MALTNKGGWNITEMHYYSSVGFTAVPLFIIATTWSLGFGLSLSVIGLCHCCHRRNSRHYNYSRSRLAYWISLVCVVLFTVASTIGRVVVYVGQDKFHCETTNTMDYVVRQANSVVESLANVSDSLDAAKNIGVDRIFLPENVRRSIDRVKKKINVSSTILEQLTHDNSDDIRQMLDSVRLTPIIVSAVMLALTFLGLLFSVLGKQRLVYTMVVSGWVLVTATFILGATFLLVHSVVGDTCVAMEDWIKNPTPKSAVDEIIPLKKHSSGPPVPILCDPFYSARTEIISRKCLHHAPEGWKEFVCHVSEPGICTTVDRLSPVYYNAISKLGSVLYNYGSFLIGLGGCTFVRKALRNMTREQCPGLRQNSKLIVIELVFISGSLMFSFIFWIFFAKAI